MAITTRLPQRHRIHESNSPPHEFGKSTFLSLFRVPTQEFAVLDR
jgi:hypothetical protein